MGLVIEMVSRRLTNIPHAGWAMRISDEMTIEKTHPTLLKNSYSGLTMALLGKIAPGDIAIGINALQEAILACQEFEMSKSVTIDSYKYVWDQFKV